MSRAPSVAGDLASPDLEARGSAATASTPVPSAPASIAPLGHSAPAASPTEARPIPGTAASANGHVPRTAGDGFSADATGAGLQAGVGPPGESFVTLTPSPDGTGGARISHQPAEERSAASPTSTDEEIPDWTLAQARAVLRENARDRDKLLDVILRYARRTFEFAGVFAVLRGEAAGWRSRGGAPGDPDFHQVRIPLDAPSIFRTVSLTRGSYVGGLPADAFSARLSGDVRPAHAARGAGRPRRGPLAPGRAGVRGQWRQAHQPAAPLGLPDLLPGAPFAFQQLVQLRRQRDGVGLALGPEAEAATDASAASASPAGTPVPGSSEPQPRVTSGWAAFDAGEHGADGPRGLGAPDPAHAGVRAVRLRAAPPPPHRAGRRGSPARGRRTRAESPTRRRAHWPARSPVPPPGAGCPSPSSPKRRSWAPSPVHSPASDARAPVRSRRSWTATTGTRATWHCSPPAAFPTPSSWTASSADSSIWSRTSPVPHALRPRRSSGCRASMPSMRGLRQELASRDPLRRSLAARALGAMHDREAIDGLIGLHRKPGRDVRASRGRRAAGDHPRELRAGAAQLDHVVGWRIVAAGARSGRSRPCATASWTSAWRPSRSSRGCSAMVSATSPRRRPPSASPRSAVGRRP